MKKFEYKQIDQSGSQTLEVIEKADKFNRYMYQTIRPFCKGKILEIGSGIGNISQFFLQDGASMVLTDIREVYCKNLETKFKDSPTLLGIEIIDLVDPDFDIKFHEYFNFFDSIFALNVVEHIAEDQLAIQNCYKLLKKEGNLIVLVPAYQQLYNRFDEALEHYRRYTVKTLIPLFTKANFKVVHKQYFNAAGILGWYVSGKLQKNQTIPEGQMALYNRLVPLFKLIDKVTFYSIGLSVIVVGEK
jgi:2-polyprenyl-3-methyl-5-hydroxy-6-metoxy-1,4-benzoquinol methylase